MKRRIEKKNISKKKKQIKKSEKTYQVYIMLSQTSTVPARLIKFYTREPYAHASIALDEDLDKMYSFARKRPNNPFITGFIKEDIESGVFARCQNTTCSIYSLKVTKEQYLRLNEEITIFKKNEDKYSYNFLGIVGCLLHKPIDSKYRYFCSQFVAYILEQSGIKLFHKHCALVRPFDIRMCPKLKCIYKGRLSDYREMKNATLVSPGQGLLIS